MFIYLYLIHKVMFFCINYYLEEWLVSGVTISGSHYEQIDAYFRMPGDISLSVSSVKLETTSMRSRFLESRLTK